RVQPDLHLRFLQRSWLGRWSHVWREVHRVQNPGLPRRHDRAPGPVCPGQSERQRAVRRLRKPRQGESGQHRQRQQVPERDGLSGGIRPARAGSFLQQPGRDELFRVDGFRSPLERPVPRGRSRFWARDRRGTPASIAPAAGLLIAVTDSFGRQLGFTYNAQRRVNSMTDPAGGQYLFEYDGSGGPAGAGNLTKLTFPDTKTRVYIYKEAAQINGGAACSSPSPVLNNALTGLSDENDSRYATWTYDCQVRVTSSVHALGVGLYSFNY